MMSKPARAFVAPPHQAQGRDAQLAHFLALGREAQAAAIRRLAAVGHSVATISAATRLAPEAIRHILEANRGR